jgi:predicted TPR repeat methyltransferase
MHQQDYFEQAIACQRAGDLAEARRLLEAALAAGPERPEIHNNLANLLVKQNQLNDALKHYAQAVHLKPDYWEAHFNLGLLFLKQANIQAAMTQFNNVISLYSEHTSAHFYLANLYFEQGAYPEAIREFEIVLRLEPFHIEAHNNIGVLHLKLDNALEAIRSFSNVLRLDEKHWEARYNLAAILLQQGRYSEASRQYEQVLKFKPDDLESRYNLGVALMPQGLLEQAIVCFESVLKKQPNYVDAHMNLAAALLKMGRREAAATHYQTVLQDQPNHPFVAYLLRALIDGAEGGDVPLSAPAAYIQHLFDSYAGYFDSHLKKTLQYETPEQLKQLLIETTGIKKVDWRVLDLGCGTGLSGAVFHDISSELMGVDLSAKMLEIARSKNIYKTLLQGDMLEVLKNQPPKFFDLILAVDVFVYMGYLEAVFEAANAALDLSGYFLFSTELCLGDGYLLQKTARYAHAHFYIETLAQKTGFSILAYKKAVLRQQENQAMEGSLYLLARAP